MTKKSVARLPGLKVTRLERFLTGETHEHGTSVVTGTDKILLFGLLRNVDTSAQNWCRSSRRMLAELDSLILFTEFSRF